MSAKMEDDKWVVVAAAGDRSRTEGPSATMEDCKEDWPQRHETDVADDGDTARTKGQSAMMDNFQEPTKGPPETINDSGWRQCPKTVCPIM